jgi:hypothetical protein
MGRTDSAIVIEPVGGNGITLGRENPAGRTDRAILPIGIKIPNYRRRNGGGGDYSQAKNRAERASDTVTSGANVHDI